jgi:hypothetical protein
MRPRWLCVGMFGIYALGLVAPALVVAQLNIGIHIGAPPLRHRS